MLRTNTNTMFTYLPAKVSDIIQSTHRQTCNKDGISSTDPNYITKFTVMTDKIHILHQDIKEI